MAETQEAGRSYAGVILAAAPEAKAEADAPMPRVSSGTQVINDTELTYAGRWESLRILPRAFGYSNNTCSSSREAGAEASYAFSSCEGIAWYAAGRQARMQPQEAGRGRCVCGRCLPRDGTRQPGETGCPCVHHRPAEKGPAHPAPGGPGAPSRWRSIGWRRWGSRPIRCSSAAATGRICMSPPALPGETCRRRKAAG